MYHIYVTVFAEIKKPPLKSGSRVRLHLGTIIVDVCAPHNFLWGQDQPSIPTFFHFIKNCINVSVWGVYRSVKNICKGT